MIRKHKITKYQGLHLPVFGTRSMQTTRIALEKPYCSVVDPGFPTGGVGPLGVRRPPTQVLFGENVCENERIGSRRGVRRARHLDPPMLLDP